jgi:hypothetical protein
MYPFPGLFKICAPKVMEPEYTPVTTQFLLESEAILLPDPALTSIALKAHWKVWAFKE